MSKSWRYFKCRLVEAVAMTVQVLVELALASAFVVGIIALAIWTLCSLKVVGAVMLFCTAVALTAAEDSSDNIDKSLTAIMVTTIYSSIGLVVANLVARTYGHQIACGVVYGIYLVFTTAFIVAEPDFH